MAPPSEFIRTPKHGVRNKVEGWSQKKYRAAKTLIPAVEVLCAAYFAMALVLAARAGHYLSMPFLLLFFPRLRLRRRPQPLPDPLIARRPRPLRGPLHLISSKIGPGG